MYAYTYINMIKKSKLEGYTQTDKTDSLWETEFVGRGFHFSCENGKNI